VPCIPPYLRTKKAGTVDQNSIARITIQHRTGHGDFEPYQIRFNREGLPICLHDRTIMTNTHYLTCYKNVPPGSELPATHFSVKRLRKFKKESKDKTRVIDTIHKWYMTRGTSKFIEVIREKDYGNITGWITDEERLCLEPSSPNSGT